MIIPEEISDRPRENLRQIKSYVQRAGRITPKQQKALKNYANQYLISYRKDKQIDFLKVFNNSKPIILEIGFGMGDSLVQMAIENPTNNYLGIEVHQAGVGNILYQINHHNIKNLLVISHDAIEVLKNMIVKESLSGIQIYFPDPWHKKKHHKRRLLNHSSIELLHQKLKVGGILHIASDWIDYAVDILRLLENNNKYRNLYCGFAPRPKSRPLTKFEKRGQNLGHKISDILFEKSI